jgi:2,3-bisphosphoglycerate-dependent phosphoglycerate mutase
METRVALIRHAESNNMVSGEVGGPLGDTGLTDKGKGQVALLGDRLARSGWHPVAVFTSPLPRAVETATTISDVLGVEMHRHDGLGYRWPQASEGLSWDEYRRYFGLLGGGVFRPYEAGIEPWAEFVARVGRTLYDILFEYAGQFVVLVTHEEMIDATFRTFGDLPLRGPFDVRVSPTSITEWTTRDDLRSGGPPDWALPRWRLDRFNDAGHLGESK